MSLRLSSEKVSQTRRSEPTPKRRLRKTPFANLSEEGAAEPVAEDGATPAEGTCHRPRPAPCTDLPYVFAYFILAYV